MNFSHFPPCVTLYNWVYCNWNTERTGADIDFQVFKLEGTKFSLFIYKSCQQAIPFFMPHMFVCKIGIPWIRFWVWRVYVFFFSFGFFLLLWMLACWLLQLILAAKNYWMSYKGLGLELWNAWISWWLIYLTYPDDTFLWREIW